eukprot:10393763-Karenia_brevis.AAC.1
MEEGQVSLLSLPVCSQQLGEQPERLEAFECERKGSQAWLRVRAHIVSNASRRSKGAATQA